MLIISSIYKMTYGVVWLTPDTSDQFHEGIKHLSVWFL